MAKGNLLLGTAKNSVGDVVMYRREGAQITRVRVRNVKNPKTDAQSFQRAIMAPIAKFYSPLSVVLERSFEGLSKAKSHNKFNQVNAGLARANKWAVPKGTGFVPLPYQLSQGTIPAVRYEWPLGDAVVLIDGPSGMTDKTTIGGLSKFFITNGYKAGDVVTFICVVDDGEQNYYPISTQFVIDETSTETIADAMPQFTIIINPDSERGVSLSAKADGTIAGAVIVARFDNNMWRRSTQYLVLNGDYMLTNFSAEKVAAAIASYGKTADDGNPLVYLDGDELTDGE